MFILHSESISSSESECNSDSEQKPMNGYQYISYLIEIFSIKLFTSLIGLYNSLFILLLYINGKNTIDTQSNEFIILIWNVKISIIIPLCFLMIIIINYVISYFKMKMYDKEIDLPKKEFYWCWINIILLLWRDINKIVKKCFYCCECKQVDNNIINVNKYLYV